MTEPPTDDSAGSSATKGLYSIGAVASMLRIRPATLRTWEERYGVVSPIRTSGRQRLYSRTQVEQLRYVVAEMASGRSAANAHRSLSARMRAERRFAPPQPRPHLLVLVAARDEIGAELLEFVLGNEGFAVEVALSVQEAMRLVELRPPDLVIVEFLMGGGEGEDLCRWLKDTISAPVLVVSCLDAEDRALRAGADAFLLKPVRPLRLVSLVNDLVGASAAHPAGVSGWASG